MRVAPNIVFRYASLINTYASSVAALRINQVLMTQVTLCLSIEPGPEFDHVTLVEFFNDPAYESGIFYEKSKKYGLKNTIIYMIARISLPDLFAVRFSSVVGLLM